MIRVEAWYRELFGGEDLPQSYGEESLGRFPQNPQAFFVDIQRELQEILQNGQPATMGPYTISPEQAQKYLSYLQATPVQAAMGWLMKMFPAKWKTYTKWAPEKPVEQRWRLPTPDPHRASRKIRELLAVPIGGVVPYEFEIQRLLNLEELHRQREEPTEKWEAFLAGVKEQILDLLHKPTYNRKKMLSLLKAWDDAVLNPHRYE